MKYLGEVDPNAILRGEVPAEKGDTFISWSVDSMGCHAFQCVFPKSPKMAHENFRLVPHVGTKDACVKAAHAAAAE